MLRVQGEVGGSVWRSYAGVYALMSEAPFVRSLRDCHVGAMRQRQRVVDAGCGVGLITAPMAAVAGRVIGLDVERAMLDAAVAWVDGLPNVALIQADVHRLPLADAACDGHVSNNVLYCLEKAALALREAARTTCTGGRLSLASPRPCMNVEILLMAFYEHLRSTGVQIPGEHLDRFVAANRALQKSLRNVYEVEDAVRLLEPYWTILDAGATYLDQNFYVLAERSDHPV